MSDDLRAAVAAGVMASEDAHRSLLQATVEVARGIFSAKAATIFLYDEATDELVFEAVSGLGAQALIGNRIPSSTGIAGWVLVTRQPLVLEDVSEDPRWGGREIAERTGYTPRGLMAVPLIHEEDSVGVCRCSTVRSRHGSRSRRWSCSACSRTRRRSHSTCSGRPGAREECSTRVASTSRPSRGSPVRSTSSRGRGGR